MQRRLHGISEIVLGAWGPQKFVTPQEEQSQVCFLLMKWQQCTALWGAVLKRNRTSLVPSRKLEGSCHGCASCGFQRQPQSWRPIRASMAQLHPPSIPRGPLGSLAGISTLCPRDTDPPSSHAVRADQTSRVGVGVQWDFRLKAQWLNVCPLCSLPGPPLWLL